MFEAEGPSNQENLEGSCGQGHVRRGILSLKPSSATVYRRYKPAKITVYWWVLMLLFVMLMEMCLSVYLWSVYMQIIAMLYLCREFHGVSVL